MNAHSSAQRNYISQLSPGSFMNVARKRKTCIPRAWQPILSIASLVTLIVTTMIRAATTARRATPSPIGQRPRTVHALTGRRKSTHGTWPTAVEYYTAGSRGLADVTATTLAPNSQPSGPSCPAFIYKLPALPTPGLRDIYMALRWTGNHGPSERSAKPLVSYRAVLVDRKSRRLGPRMCALAVLTYG